MTGGGNSSAIVLLGRGRGWRIPGGLTDIEKEPFELSTHGDGGWKGARELQCPAFKEGKLRSYQEYFKETVG